MLTREIPVTAEANPDGGPDGVDNVDWEAITVDDAGNLHVGDIGDYWDGSSRSRNSDPNVADTRVYRIPEPDPYTATSPTVASVSEFTYPDGEEVNAEALFWHDGSLFLITKEGGGVARLFRLDLGSGRAVPLGVVDAVLDPVTGADVSDDGRNLAMATDSLRLVVLGTTGDPSPGVQGVVDLATAPDLRSHHYYRSAAALEADGQLERRREDPRVGRPPRRQPAGSEAYSRTAMQVEGVAFEHGGSGLGLIAEYGRHVAFVPLDVWSLRTGDGRSGG